MKKRRFIGVTFSLILIFCLSLGLWGFTDGSGGAASSSVLSESGDFSLEISVNKTVVHVGDTVEVTATFRNLSGRDWFIEYPGVLPIGSGDGIPSFEDLIWLDVRSDYNGWMFLDVAVVPGYGFILEKDAVFSRTEELCIEELRQHVAIANVHFYMADEDFHDSSEYAEKYSWLREREKYAITIEEYEHVRQEKKFTFREYLRDRNDFYEHFGLQTELIEISVSI